eukprot:Rhum_TRINITY_DN10183_c0_g1::Rhum_TRINITY_DN10183_c0_g1_i1::g.37011::m.37011
MPSEIARINDQSYVTTTAAGWSQQHDASARGPSPESLAIHARRGGSPSRVDSFQQSQVQQSQLQSQQSQQLQPQVQSQHQASGAWQPPPSHLQSSVTARTAHDRRGGSPGREASMAYASAPPPPPSTSAFSIGDRVAAAGLTQNPGFNGVQGTVVGHQPEGPGVEEQYLVDFSEHGQAHAKPKALLRANLLPADAPQPVARHPSPVRPSPAAAAAPVDPSAPRTSIAVTRYPGEADLGCLLSDMVLRGVRQGSPAERCGVGQCVGMRLLEIDGVSVHDRAAVSLTGSAQGQTSVTLTFLGQVPAGAGAQRRVSSPTPERAYGGGGAAAAGPPLVLRGASPEKSHPHHHAPILAAAAALAPDPKDMEITRLKADVAFLQSKAAAQDQAARAAADENARLKEQVSTLSAALAKASQGPLPFTASSGFRPPSPVLSSSFVAPPSSLHSTPAALSLQPAATSVQALRTMSSGGPGAAVGGGGVVGGALSNPPSTPGLPDSRGLSPPVVRPAPPAATAAVAAAAAPPPWERAPTSAPAQQPQQQPQQVQQPQAHPQYAPQQPPSQPQSQPQHYQQQQQQPHTPQQATSQLQPSQQYQQQQQQQQPQPQPQYAPQPP